MIKSIETLKKEVKAMVKGNKSLDKEVTKQNDIAKRTTKTAIKKATIEANKKERAERSELNKVIKQGKKDLIAKRSKVKAMQKQNANGIRALEKIKGVFGLHPNSPKSLSDNPWSYAIPVSIIKTTNFDYPGMFRPVKKDGSNKPYALESNNITLNFDDHITFKIFIEDANKKVSILTRDYSQGLTKYLKDILKDNLRKKAA